MKESAERGQEDERGGKRGGTLFGPALKEKQWEMSGEQNHHHKNEEGKKGKSTTRAPLADAAEGGRRGNDEGSR